MKKYNFREYDQQQGLIHPIIPSELLDDEHCARKIDFIVEQLDLSKIYSTYSQEGNPSYHPKMMLKVLFYSYYVSTMSSRKIHASLGNGRADYIFLSGGQVPDHRTVNYFRSRHLDVIPTIFTQIVLLCEKLGMIGFEHLAIDGQKIQANANFRKSYDKKRLEKRFAEIKKGMKKIVTTPIDKYFSQDTKKKRIKKLKKEMGNLQWLVDELKTISVNEKKINTTDPEAAIMTHKDGTKKPSYNHQSAVDKKFGITVAVETKDNVDVPSDLLQLTDSAKNKTGKSYKNVSGDSAFSDYETLQSVHTDENRCEDFYVPDKNINAQDDKKYFDQEKFKKKKDGGLICPAGYEMKIKNQTEDEKTLKTTYEGLGCSACKLKGSCTKGKSRTVTIDSRYVFRDMMRKKLLSIKGREIYRERQWIVEAGHGDDQKNKGWRQHYLRGKAKANLEFLLIRIAANIGKIIRFKGQELMNIR